MHKALHCVARALTRVVTLAHDHNEGFFGRIFRPVCWGLLERHGFLLIIGGFVKTAVLSCGRHSTLKTIAPETESEAEEYDFKPLTAQEADQWRSRHPPASLWRVVAGQALAGLLVALLVWLWTGSAQVAWSAAYGALTVVVPAALFARGISRQKASAGAGAAMAGFFGWEIAKIALSVALLLAAPRLVPGLNWIALVMGMVITMKMYWVALLVRPGVRKTD